MYKSIVKRLIDIILSLGFLTLTLPIFILIFFILLFVNKGYPFFFQHRPGKNSKPFLLVKFRTMNHLKNIDGELLSDEKRLSRFGRLLRKSSLDELPQLINVLKGEMSLIGPRPLLMEYLSLYTPDQLKRHEVKPGITGWAQVNGRNSISWDDKFILDLWYVNNISFSLDLRILILSIKKVLQSDGITGNNVATVEKFKGYKKD